MNKLFVILLVVIVFSGCAILDPEREQIRKDNQEMKKQISDLQKKVTVKEDPTPEEKTVAKNVAQVETPAPVVKTPPVVSGKRVLTLRIMEMKVEGSLLKVKYDNSSPHQVTHLKIFFDSDNQKVQESEYYNKLGRYCVDVPAIAGSIQGDYVVFQIPQTAIDLDVRIFFAIMLNNRIVPGAADWLMLYGELVTSGIISVDKNTIGGAKKDEGHCFFIRSKSEIAAITGS